MKKLLSFIFMLAAFSATAYAAVNINTATQAQLQMLHGIGPTKAKAIVDHRKENGAFKSVDDLRKVNGIESATVTRLRKDLSVSGPTVIPKKTVSSAQAKPSVKKAASSAKTRSPAKAKPAAKTKSTTKAKSGTKTKPATKTKSTTKAKSAAK